MRVRILRQVYLESTRKAHQPNSVVNLPAKVAKSLVAAGIAMEDKSHDGAKETRDEQEEPSQGLYWCTECGCSHDENSDIGKEHTLKRE